MLEVYFRRFGRSAYSGALKRQIVRFAVERPAVDEHAPLDVFETAVGHLPQRDQLDIYAELAKEAVAKSRRDLVTLASGRVQALGEAAPNYRSRATLYMAALNVASLDVVKARNDLAGIPREHLSADEIELMGAAKAISEQIDRVLTVIPTDRPEAEWTQELSQTFANVARSRTLIEGADKLLSEASK